MKNFALIIILSALSLSCLKEDYFGKSNRNQIKAFEIEGQVGSTTIDHVGLTVEVPISDTLTGFELSASNIVTSNFSNISPGVGSIQDFSGPIEYVVTAEDGQKAVYMVSVARTGSDQQIPNASFEDWYQETLFGKTVYQPGVDAQNKIWDTANRGMALGGAESNTTPEQKNADSLFVRMETVAAPALVRIATGTVFTGAFTTGIPDPSDPASNLTLGTPFSGRPLSFSFSYKYQPGPNNEDENGTALSYPDQFDAYLLLENRESGSVIRVGTSWLRNGDVKSNWTSVSTPVKYGPLDSSDPWYSYAQPGASESWGVGNEKVTHITILLRSSFEGDSFKGAVGSVFDVDNISLGY